MLNLQPLKYLNAKHWGTKYMQRKKKSLQSIHSNASWNRLYRPHFWARTPFLLLLHTASARPLSPTNLSWGKHYITSNWWFKSENHACHLRPDKFQILQLLGHANRAEEEQQILSPIVIQSAEKFCLRHKPSPCAITRATPEVNIGSDIPQHSWVTEFSQCPVQSNNKNTLHYKHKRPQARLISGVQSSRKHFEHKSHDSRRRTC